MLIVLNPKAGKCSGAKKLGAVLQIFQNAGFLPTVMQTGQSGDARQFALLLAARFDVVVCIGGDGTFSEVVSGINAAGCDVPIGYIPTGSTNDYAASLGLAKAAEQAAADIIDGTPRRFDIGLFGGQPFVYVASFGGFARVSYTASQNMKNMLGHLAYILEGISDLPTIRPCHARLETDDRVLEGDYLFGAVSNSTSIGGILQLSNSGVSLDDGMLEILLVKNPAGPKELAQLLQAISTSTYANNDCISFCSSKRVRVWTDEQTPWTLDGERAQGAACISIATLPRAIGVILPPERG